VKSARPSKLAQSTEFDLAILDVNGQRQGDHAGGRTDQGRAPAVHFRDRHARPACRKNIAIAPRCKNRFSWKRWRR